MASEMNVKSCVTVCSIIGPVSQYQDCVSQCLPPKLTFEETQRLCELVESIVGTSTFDLNADATTRDAEGWHEAGSYFRLDAVCGCGHRWRIKGAIQVTCLDAKPIRGT